MTIVQMEREKQGMSQIELSRRSGVKQPIISDIESGKTKSPRVETIKALASVLGFDWAAFYGETGQDTEKAV